jgi:hypothetical protein
VRSFPVRCEIAAAAEDNRAGRRTNRLDAACAAIFRERNCLPAHQRRGSADEAASQGRRRKMESREETVAREIWKDRGYAAGKAYICKCFGVISKMLQCIYW